MSQRFHQAPRLCRNFCAEQESCAGAKFKGHLNVGIRHKARKGCNCSSEMLSGKNKSWPPYPVGKGTHLRSPFEPSKLRTGNHGQMCFLVNIMPKLACLARASQTWQPAGRLRHFASIVWKFLSKMLREPRLPSAAATSALDSSIGSTARGTRASNPCT